MSESGGQGYVKAELTREIVIFPELCNGCRSCEVACSYHHTTSFNRRRSSIYIRRMERKGEFEITIHRDGNKRPACDLCKDEKLPLCVKYCATDALRIKEGEQL